ncbi:MAG: AarF/ABC1/UbiB kinase family protein [Sandaracinaceae bacterium]|nr:AarF/ABC1/UbiB kinase family protein [Sandaracinaceae bacterium]
MHREISRPRRPRRDPDAGLREWLRLLDAVLGAIEAVVWDVREIGEQTWEETRGTPRKVKRLAATGWCLTAIATSYRLHVTRSAFVTRGRAARQLEALHQKNARRFYELCVGHGGAFLKVGQLLSARADLLPAAWITELSKLQDQVPGVPFEAVRATLEEDLGVELAEVFSSFDEAPIAAASIGQVHRATTTGGLEVAVKIRRPDIDELVVHDLDLLEAFIGGVRDQLPPSDWDTIVAEVRAMVMAELDYPRERATMERLEAFFAEGGFEGIRVPAPVPELCTERVLVASFEPGVKITDALDALHAAGETKRVSTILGRLLEAYVAQVIEAGVFQADPHPGNFLVTEADELVVLDFGCAKELPASVRRTYLGLVQAALLSDRAGVIEHLDALGFATRSGSHETLERFADAMLRDFRDAVASGAMRFGDGDAMIAQARGLMSASEHDPVVRVPDHFVMIGRVFGTLGGLFAHYQPTIDYARHVLPSFTRGVRG